jgi:hypothetical protein
VADNLRVHRRYVQTPMRRYTHPRTGRRTWLVSICHQGEPAYFVGIKSTVDGLMADGAVVHAEGTHTSPEDLAQATPRERKVLDAQFTHDARSQQAPLFSGWVNQDAVFGGVPEGWQQVDLSMLAVIRLAGVEVMLASLNERNAALSRAQTRMDRLATIDMFWTEHTGRRLPDKPTDTILVGRRTQFALDARDGVHGDVVLVWGAAHQPGLAAGLHARGYVPDIETWRTVGRMPSRWTLAPTIVALAPAVIASTIRARWVAAIVTDDAVRALLAPR